MKKKLRLFDTLTVPEAVFLSKKSKWISKKNFRVKLDSIDIIGYIYDKIIIWKYKNAENFSTKALAINVVLFALWWSALTYDRLKLLRFDLLTILCW